MNTKERQGLALIIVAGVLGLLAALAMAFTTLAQIERRASRQRLNVTKATLLARSGIEDAMARLGAGQDSEAGDNRYYGEDWNKDGLVNAGAEEDGQVYRPGSAGSPADTDACPVRHAMRPSFCRVVGVGGNARLVDMGGHQRGYTGALGDRPTEGSVYALKVTTEGGFYVNGGDPLIPVNTAVSDYNLNLRRMLGILAEAVDRDPVAGVPGADDGVPVDQVDGFNLIDSRPRTPRGWESWDQVRDLALGGSQGKLDALRPYLALHARVDRKVIRPNAVPGTASTVPPGMEGQSYQSWADIKLAHETYPLALGTKEPDFERIPVTSTGKIVGRAPVDLAWARTRRPVLIALLAGLKGLYLDETAARPIETGDHIGTLRPAVIALDWTATSDNCRRAADGILASTSELRTWEQWNAFCDTLTFSEDDTALLVAQASIPDPAAYQAACDAYSAYQQAEADYWEIGIITEAEYNDAVAAYNAFCAANGDASTTIITYQAFLAAYNAALDAYNAALAAQVERSLLKANFNPNSDLNKFGPNASLWRSVDKSDLLVYSTEFNLLPAASPQELECVGRVLGRNGRVLASRVLRVELAPAGLLTLSTQKEFVCGDLGDLSVAGDEVSPRLPGAFPFISQSAGSGGKTWGHALDGLGNVGASLQTYPEPCVDTRPYPQSPPAVLSIRPADYDGSVQLATMETPDNGFYTADSGTPTADMKLLARYTAGLDLDVADAASPPFNNPAARFNQPDTQQVTYNGAGSPDLPELGNGLLDAAKPNTLYPDGVYSEKDHAPAYLDRGNADGFHGVISFWIKSNYWNKPAGTGAENETRDRPFLKWTHFVVSSFQFDPPNQFFFLGDYPRSGRISYRLECGQRCGGVDDQQQEHAFELSRRLTPRQWSLLTIYYDFRSTTKDRCGELRLNAGLNAGDWDSIEDYAKGNTPAWASDITRNDLFGPHRLGLGAGRPITEGCDVGTFFGSGPDSTFDELAIYDFGGATYVSGISTAASDATLQSPGKLASVRFKEGRYYRESAYTNLASAGTNRAAEYFSPPISLGPCRIKALAWTQIVPRGLKAPFTGGQVGVDGDPVEGPGNPGDGDPGDGRIVLELADSSGTGYLQDASGNSINTLFTRSALERVDRAVAAPFRLHAVFQPNLKDRENTPILDPLALDDVTVVYEPLGGRRILAWGQGE